MFGLPARGVANMEKGLTSLDEQLSGNGIEAAIKLYVRLGNISALTDQKLHRSKLLAQYKDKDSDAFNFRLLRERCEQDLSAINAGIRELLKHETTRGYLDVCTPERISGWTQFVRHPEIPVELTVYFDQKSVGQTVADQYRHDLEQANLGSGRHGFEFVPEKTLFLAAKVVEVKAPNGTIIETYRNEPPPRS
jgi:hypothetical protein